MLGRNVDRDEGGLGGGGGIAMLSESSPALRYCCNAYESGLLARVGCNSVFGDVDRLARVMPRGR